MTEGAPNQYFRLLTLGEAVMVGDEVWDDDLKSWEMVRITLSQRVRRHDVVRRTCFDVSALLLSFDGLLSELRGREVVIEPGWWARAESYMQEAKRRLGVKTVGTYERA